MKTLETNTFLDEISSAKDILKTIINRTPITLNRIFSQQYNANIYLKREDLQPVRSYKLRGAYYKIQSLSNTEKKQGIICASAGNHAQGVAYSCNLLGIYGKIYMPATTPNQKIKQVKIFGEDFVEIVLHGDTFDDAYAKAVEDANENNKPFIHPFDDSKVIAGQGTIALELLEDLENPIDYLFVPVGGGGLLAGLVSVFKTLSPKTKIIGVEPEGAASMKTALQENKVVNLPKIDKFVDGAAVKEVGKLNFEIVKNHISEIITVPEGKTCTTILKLYNEQAIVVEPAGALSISALDFYAEKIKNKNVVCIISGSNNDIERTEEIKEKSLLYEGLKHYFMIGFPQRPGALKEFVNHVLGENDDISYFQFSKKNSKEMGPAVVGIELKNKEDFPKLLNSLEKNNIEFTYLNGDNRLFTYLI